jgi:APA family basic amino acid/polyamine antiporter
MRNHSQKIMSSSSHSAGRLRRDLGLVGAVGIGLGAVMGAGIFVVTGVAAGVAGPAFLVGLAVAGVAAAFNGLSSAQLAANFPQSGGTYEYGRRLIHPLAGFAAGWMFLAGKLAAAGTVAIGFGHYASAMVPGASPVPMAVAAVVLLTLANLFGVKRAGALNLAIVLLTLGALGCFVGGGWTQVHGANFRPFAPHGWHAVAESCALLFFAYTGYARLATLGEEVREPARNIPRAIVLTLILSFVVYLSVGMVAAGAVGADALAASRAPLETAAATFGKPWIARFLAAGAATAMLGVLLSQILGISRMMLAMARNGDLPRFLDRIDETRSVPSRAIVLTGAIAATLAIAGKLEAVIAAAAFTILIYYALTNLAAIRLADSQRLYPQWIAWAGLLACIAMAVSLQPRTILAGTGLLAVGFAFRFRAHRLASGRKDDP